MAAKGEAFPEKMRERVFDHPLASRSNSPHRSHLSTPGSTSTTNSSTINTASLIQSAARSVLDSTTPDSNVSDDEESNVNGSSGSRRRSYSATLRSLQKEKIPAMPGELDRKRFVGCLAAVLATSYDYDFSEPCDNTAQSRAASDAYLNRAESGIYSDEEEDIYDFGDQNCSFYDENESFEEDVSQERPKGLRGKIAKSKKDEERGTRAKLVRRRESEKRIAKAQNRHRRRRYELMSKLLLSSGEMLQLDQGHARALLPMLAKVLVPPPAPDISNEEEKMDLDNNSTTPEKFSSMNGQGNYQHFFPEEIDKDDHLRPFLESLTPGAGFRCLALLLLQHLLHSEQGYDARTRHVMKKLGVVVLIYEMERDSDIFSQEYSKGSIRSFQDLLGSATRIFESLEHTIAARLIRLSKAQQRMQQQRQGQRSHTPPTPDRKVARPLRSRISREQLIRGLKIGSAGIVAGTLFAVSGGMAAPGIAAGLGMVAGSTAATAVATLVSSSTAVTAIFGVGGGSLAAYKMNRRVQGLTQFEFHKEGRKDLTDEASAELFTTICLSGWLTSVHDFQRPWGVQPTRPRLTDRQELLERFYSINRPEHIRKCKKILSQWRGEEKELWELLRRKYGRDPDHLFPLEHGPKFEDVLALEEEEILNMLFLELGYVPKNIDHTSLFAGMRSRWRPNAWSHLWSSTGSHKESPAGSDQADLLNLGALPHSTARTHLDEFDNHSTQNISYLGDSFDGESALDASTIATTEEPENEYVPPKHLSTVWDYQCHYGGEMYTVRWESDMLLEVCDSVTDLAVDLINGATAQLLKQTALSTFMTAVAVPYALVNAANMIDAPWALAVERADLAGKELARSLLFSRAGHRPVTLVGFSFGARAIYSCLKELVHYQEVWEDSLQDFIENGTKSPGKKGEISYLTREPASIVEDAILMGLPNHMSNPSWKACRQVVAGRLINCYSRKDMILSLMFQLKHFAGTFRSVCGTTPVEVPGVENFDVTDLISSHQDYCHATGAILSRIRHGQPFRSSIIEVTESESDTSSRKIDF